MAEPQPSASQDPTPSPRRSSPPAPLLHAAPSGSPPPTPRIFPQSQLGSHASVDTGSSHRSRQEYMDQLQPPSDGDFERLAKVQDDRERDHRHRDYELQQQNIVTARQSMEARRDFMQAKAVKESAQDRPSFFSHQPSRSRSSRRSRCGSENASSANGAGDADCLSVRAKAAIVIQRSYRGYRVRREMRGLGLDASTRWAHAIKDAQWQEVTQPRSRRETFSSLGTNDTNNGRRQSSSRSAARQNWMKVATIARRAGGDENSLHSRTSSLTPSDEEDLDNMTPEQIEKRRKAQAKRKNHAQVMGLQYFLEMVDVKHRYGSNLRTYHEEWKKSDTQENFFYWLDYGEGKTLNLLACPRERLERERVRYLSREERQYYLVKVDWQGRLVWAKNGVRIDTTEAWKDSMHGIVPADDPTPAFAPDIETHVQSKPSQDAQPQPHDHSVSGSESGSSRESKLEAAMAAKYANPGFDDAKGLKKIRHVSAATIFNKLLRKSVRRNTWIFVADTSFRLYVGIKNSGAFQHSSFLHGSRISAAGLIKVKNGRLSSLSPLSGHYRPPASNFRAFVHSLEDEGADMSHVSISKSYAVLVGLEAYVKTQKKGKDAVQRISHRKLKFFEPEEAAKKEEAQKDKSKSAAREREVLEKERREDEQERTENKTSVRFMQKLGWTPRTLRTQNDAAGGNNSLEHEQKNS